jgi:hypothetical protein
LQVILDEDPDSKYYGLFEAGMEIFMNRYVIEPEFMAAACLDPGLAYLGATRALLESQKLSHTKVLLKVIKKLKISELIKEKRQKSGSPSDTDTEEAVFQIPSVPRTPTTPGPQSQSLFDSFPFDSDVSSSTQVIFFIFAYFFSLN